MRLGLVLISREKHLTVAVVMLVPGRALFYQSEGVAEAEFEGNASHASPSPVVGPAKDSKKC